jgi:hypothetical protein
MNTTVRYRPKLIIPTRYSRFGCLSSFSILRLAICCYTHGESVLGQLVLFLYITSNLHWYRVYKHSLYWKMDRILTMICFLYSAWRAYHYDCGSIYYFRTMVHLYAFFINDYWNKKTIYKPSRMARMSPMKKNLHYFRACSVHFLFLHYLQTNAGIHVLTYCKRI